ncbi:MAG TPA: DUF2961 domain-containing protein [Polyangiales bacterium]|nr:DUF2961 domain-containing protein [Polyangiales bacterium]
MPRGISSLLRFAACSMLVCVGSTASSLGCTPVNDYRVDKPKRDDANKDEPSKFTPEDTPQAGKSSQRADAADSDKKSTRTGSAGDAAKGGAGGRSSEPKGGSPADAKASKAGAGGSPANAAGGDPSAPPEAPSRPDSEARKQAGWAALTDWAALPTFGASTTQLFSTHERGESTSFPLIDPGNKDFNSFLALCGEHPDTVGQQNDASVACGPGQTGYLVAADDGPGYVSRMLLARGISSPSSSVLVELRPMNERIRVYVDNEQRPVVDSLWSELADANNAPFNSPLTSWTSGGTISYLPISYSNRLRVFVDDLNSSSTLTLYYIHVTTHRVQSTEPFDPAVLAGPDARAELDRLMDAPNQVGAVWFDKDVTLADPGASTVWSRDRPGTLRRIELELPAEGANEVLSDIALRLSWDDDSAAVDLPLGAMFGSRHGVTPVSTLPLSVKSDANTVNLRLSLPMPFASSAKLELVRAGETSRTLKLRLSGTDDVPKGEWGHLRSAFSEQHDPRSGDRLRVAALSGRGKYLGSILYAHGKADSSGQVRASELGFLEGDERLDVDGQTIWLGTGTDNYFNGGFYFKDGPFNSPFAAVSQLDADSSSGTSAVTLMRWTMLTDEINFQKQLELSFELGANRPATVRDYAAVSFYYQ